MARWLGSGTATSVCRLTESVWLMLWSGPCGVTESLTFISASCVSGLDSQHYLGNVLRPAREAPEAVGPTYGEVIMRVLFALLALLGVAGIVFGVLTIIRGMQ